MKRPKYLLRPGPPKACTRCGRLAETGVSIAGMILGVMVEDGVLCIRCNELSDRDEELFWIEWKKLHGV